MPYGMRYCAADVIAQDFQGGGGISGGGEPSMQSESAAQDYKCSYDSAELRIFEEITDGILAALVRAENYPLEPGVTESLRLRIASALFETGKGGELDPDMLKRRVLAQFYTAATEQRSRAR